MNIDLSGRSGSLGSPIRFLFGARKTTSSYFVSSISRWRSSAAMLSSAELDGLGSGQFLRAPVYALEVRTVSDSSRHKKVFAPCPSGHTAIGGDARITATRVPDTDGVPGTGSEVPAALTAVEGVGTAVWRAEAQEMAPFEGDWYLLVQTLCVPEESQIAPAGQ